MKFFFVGFMMLLSAMWPGRDREDAGRVKEPKKDTVNLRVSPRVAIKPFGQPVSVLVMIEVKRPEKLACPKITLEVGPEGQDYIWKESVEADCPPDSCEDVFYSKRLPLGGGVWRFRAVVERGKAKQVREESVQIVGSD